MTVASVFANITAVAGTNAAVVTTAAAATAVATAAGGSEIGLETFFHGYNLCVLYSC